MVNIFSKFSKTIQLVLGLIFAIILGACGSTENLLGGAGLDDVTLTEPPVATEIPLPTETPIPAAVGHIIFVSNRDGQMSLYMSTPDGVEQTRLTAFASEDTDPHISPDGNRVAFVSNVAGNTDIYVLDLATRAITRLTDAEGKDTSPSWSPDGTRIAFESFRDGNFEIYVVNADGTGTARLTDDPAGDSSPVWSPVSNEIAFVSNRFGNSDIFILGLNGSVSTLTTNFAPDSAPAWSPDGTRIAFKTYTGELVDLCMINRDALGQHCVTEFASEYGSPVWSPDGQWLAASAKQSAGYGISLFHTLDTSTVQLYSVGVEPKGDPIWSPDGTRLAFQAQSSGDMELYIALVPTNEFARLTSVSAYDGDPIWINQ